MDRIYEYVKTVAKVIESDTMLCSVSGVELQVLYGKIALDLQFPDTPLTVINTVYKE